MQKKDEDGVLGKLGVEVNQVRVFLLADGGRG
jgi:hypothetical protein